MPLNKQGLTLSAPSTGKARTNHGGDRPEHHNHRITLAQGIALIFGTNIGAGILSIPYASRDGGFLSLVIALIIAGTLTTFSMLYVAEVALRTQEDFQLSGLAEKYLGQAGRWLVFVAIMVNGDRGSDCLCLGVGVTPA